ncbi:hypothetical protein [Adhaeribacter pallidiroseus]|uniref:hypothetical protein n=1 Tax=Adhaeribacter pallidiroseus TaxID=2072847 RepID=UPI000E1BF537|nr:hypothetical protein [Adhaeribacter pallidiroseus]
MKQLLNARLIIKHFLFIAFRKLLPVLPKGNLDFRQYVVLFKKKGHTDLKYAFTAAIKPPDLHGITFA